jgi:hypothetical protein
MTNRKLDWKSEHDERSRDYNIMSVINAGVAPQRKMWEEGTVLDQGNEGACVGFGWMGEYLATPAAPPSQPPARLAEAYAKDIYASAKTVDEFPGENYEGTSVLAGAKVMKSRGFIQSYRWAFSIEAVRDAIIQEGPVVIGVPWKEGMYDTAAGGVVKVSGKSVGGHCLVLTGYDPAMKIGSRKYEVYRWRNSWGSSYGVGGSGYIKATDLAKLLKGVGEACVPIGRQVPNTPKLGIPPKQNFVKTILERVLTKFKR